MKKYFKIHDGYINTDYGNTAWEHLRPELSQLNPKQSLSERFIDFLELKTLTRRVILTDNLRPYFQRMNLDCEIQLIASAFDTLIDQLAPEPIWVLTASNINRGLIAVLLSSEPDFDLNEDLSKPADISLGVSPSIPIEQHESFDLSKTEFSFEQQIILSLLAAQTLRESPLFQASSFSLIIKEKQYSLVSQGRQNKIKTIDLTSFYYLSEVEVRAQLWDHALVEAELRDPPFSFSTPDYSEFIAWANTWLQDPQSAIRLLINTPSSPFLFQALALHGDPKLFAEHADKLVSIDYLDLRQIMNLMFDEVIMTRPGLSLDEYNSFMSYDPNHIRALCERLSENNRVKRMQAQGLAIDFWRRCEDHQ